MKKNRDVSYRRKYNPAETKKKRRIRNGSMLLVMAVLLVVLIPVSQMPWARKQYLSISMFVLLMGMLPVFVSFEQRRPQAREVVLLSVLTALCVGVNVLCSHTIPLHAGTMMVILSGIALGPEAGFFVGAVGRLLCNFFDGQGPWTPWQMLTWGMLGLLGGIVFYRKSVRGNTMIWKKAEDKKTYQDSIWWMTGFTFVVVVVVYGGIMNFAAWLMNHAWDAAGSPLSKKVLLATYIAGFSYDVSHGIGASVCMFLFGEGLLRTIRRIQIQYGIYIGEDRWL